MAHAHVGAELAAARRARSSLRRRSGRPACARSRGSAVRAARSTSTPRSRSRQSSAGSPSSVERRRCARQAVTRAHRPDRLAALRDARHQRRRRAPKATPDRPPCEHAVGDVHACRVREPTPGRRTGSRLAVRSLSSAISSARSGVAGSACTSARARRRSRAQRPRAGEDAGSCSRGSVGQHQRQRRLVEVLDAAGRRRRRRPRRPRRRPASAARSSSSSASACGGVVVGEVEPAERRLGRAGAAALRVDLRRGQRQRLRASRGAWRGACRNVQAIARRAGRLRSGVALASARACARRRRALRAAARRQRRRPSSASARRRRTLCLTIAPARFLAASVALSFIAVVASCGELLGQRAPPLHRVDRRRPARRRRAPALRAGGLARRGFAAAAAARRRGGCVGGAAAGGSSATRAGRPSARSSSSASTASCAAPRAPGSSRPACARSARARTARCAAPRCASRALRGSSVGATHWPMFGSADAGVLHQALQEIEARNELGEAGLESSAMTSPDEARCGHRSGDCARCRDRRRSGRHQAFDLEAALRQQPRQALRARHVQRARRRRTRAGLRRAARRCGRPAAGCARR